MSGAVISSSVLIVVVIVLRRMLKGKISQRLQYALWALAAIRLLLPFSLLASPVSVMNVLDIQREPNAAVSSYETSMNGVVPKDPYAFVESTGSPGQTDAGMPDRAEAAPVGQSPVPIAEILRLAWLCGIVITTACLVWANVRFFRKLKKQATRVEADDCPLPVFCVPVLSSPCLYGIFRPAIYLTPESLACKERMRHVLAHELTHYAHKDHLWALLRSICIAVHWFNPLVWAAAALSKRDCETACDEGAIKRLGEEHRIAYGRTLIGMLTAPGHPSDLLRLTTMMSAGKSGIRERIELIAGKPGRYASALAAAIVIVAVATACTFTDAVRYETASGASPIDAAESPPTAGQAAVSPALDAAVSEAIITHNAKSYRGGEFKTESHFTLKAVEDEKSAVVYMMAFYAEYDFPGGTPKLVSGSHIPVALTFAKDKNGAFHLKEYWEASDGSRYMSSIKKKFPPDAWQQADTQNLAQSQQAASEEKASAYLRGRMSEEELLNAIISEPKNASNPHTYIASHREAYDTLVSRGDTSLRYIFSRFIAGEQNGLEGWIMLLVCRDIIGEELKPRETGNSPQEVFDEYAASVVQTGKTHSDEYMEKHYPGANLLLKMLKESHVK